MYTNKGKKHKFWYVAGVVLKCFLAMSFIWPIYFVILYKYVPIKVTPLMIQRFLEGEKESKWANQTWIEYNKISPSLVRAVITSEDNLFPKHYGFSIEQIKKAIADSKNGKRLRGGSTISQQCAKNVFLPHSRSYIRKAYEAYFTMLIELIWGKRRIMEVYLNVIEMGPGVYGAEEASQRYFKQKASQLTDSQSALVAACLPNPRKYRIDKPSQYTKERQAKILKMMPNMGKIELH